MRRAEEPSAPKARSFPRSPWPPFSSSWSAVAHESFRARILPHHEGRKAAVHVSRVREALLLLGPRGNVPAEGEVLLLQRGDFPERRATRASGTSAASPQTRSRGSARRRGSITFDLRRSVSNALAKSLRHAAPYQGGEGGHGHHTASAI